MGVSIVNGILVMLAALFFQSLKELSLFDLMMQVSTLIQVPLLVPLLLGQFIRHTPSWAPWATVALGMSVSWFMSHLFSAQLVADWLGMATLTPRESSDLTLMLSIAAHLFITAGFFCFTALFYKPEKDKNREHTIAFFKDVNTPYEADAGQDEYDKQQRQKLGTMVIVMGFGMAAMTLIPNPPSGRFILACCAAVILFIGYLLKRSVYNESI